MSKITRGGKFVALEDRGEIAGDSIIDKKSILPGEYPLKNRSDSANKRMKAIPDQGGRQSQTNSAMEEEEELMLNIDLTSEKDDEDLVDKQILRQLILNNDIPEAQARKAIIQTGNKSAKDATVWYYKNISKGPNFRSLLSWMNEASRTNRFTKNHYDDRGRLDPTRHIRDEYSNSNNNGDGKTKNKEFVLQYMVQLTA